MRLHHLPRISFALVFHALTLSLIVPSASASFIADGNMGLPAFKAGVDMTWGDYDSDGDLDLLTAGDTGMGPYVTQIWRHEPGPAFVALNPGLPGVNRGSVAWGDEDGDGDLDILLTGDANGMPQTAIYLQTSPGNFVLKGTMILAVTDGEAAWGDYDNDGDQDVLISGLSFGTRYSRVYRHNPDGQYEWVTGISLTGLSESDVSWIDSDNDGDQDIFINGFDGANYVSRLYRNDGNEVFLNTQTLTGVSEGESAWSDYDVDGDLDLILTGRGPTGGSRTTRLYTNDFGSFNQDFSHTPPAYSQSEAAWGDYDNDGRPDLILCGYNGSTPVSTVYHNISDFINFQTLSVSGLPAVKGGAVAWGDYTNDGRLDFVIAGETATGYTIAFFRNTILGSPPPVPTASAGVSLTVNPPQFHFFNTTGLTSNLRVGRTPGGNELWPGLSAPSGQRRVATMGNMGTAQNVPFTPSAGPYFWSAQNVDASLRGSAFTPEQRFCVFDSVDIGELPPSGDYVQDAAWGDFDGDGDQDLAYVSTNDHVGVWFRRNNGGIFASPQNLGNDICVFLKAADVDNDGDLDLAVASGIYQGALFLLVNQGDAVFNRVTISDWHVTNDLYWGIAWGDYDNDGDQDLIATVRNIAGTWTHRTEILRNDGNLTFTKIVVPGVTAGVGRTAWGDYDNDGDLDCAVTGADISSYTRLLRNDGNLSVVPSPFQDAIYGSLAWADYDNDGDLDLALSGDSPIGKILKLYRNDGGTFTDIPMGLPGFGWSSLTWGDYDNDGSPDLLVSGITDLGPLTLLVVQSGGTFTNVAAGLMTFPSSLDVDFVDYDMDGDLDISMSSVDATSPYPSQFQIYRNDCASPNTAPTSPGGLHMDYPLGLTTTFRWDPGSDAETPVAGLSYNLRVGTTQIGNEIMSSMSQWNVDPMSESPRWIGGLGNTQMNRAWRVKLPPVSYIAWSVQSIDAGGKASEFASLQQVILGPWINTIKDIPNDEGGQVEIKFGASHLDWAGEPTYPIVNYKVWKRTNPTTWSLLTTIPAAQIAQYTVLAPTDADSSALGTPWQVYYVSAQTSSPSVTISSLPDSGYSLDNMAPSMPQGFTAMTSPSPPFGVELHWLPSTAPDFQTFRIYRGNFTALAAGTQGASGPILVHQTPLTQWLDTIGNLSLNYYELAAVDSAGNESQRASTAGQSDAGPVVPTFVDRLYPASPNPFSAATKISFTLRSPGRTTVEIFDLSGRLVRRLVDADMPEGAHDIAWDGQDATGNPATSGIYFARIRSREFTDTERLVLGR